MLDWIEVRGGGGYNLISRDLDKMLLDDRCNEL